MNSPPGRSKKLSCWLCDRLPDDAGLADGLCAECAQKGADIDVSMKMEEYERMKALHRLISSAVYHAIEAADVASMERNDATRNDKK